MHHRADNWAALEPRDTSLPLAPTIRQIDGLQVLRAIAVILVIWCPAGQLLSEFGSPNLPGLNVFGIDIFFVISGFILSLVVLRERRQPGITPMADFMKRRLIRIYPIYWFVALLMLARLALSGNLFQANYLPAFLLMPSLHYPGDRLIMGYSWTMMFEMFFYLLLGLLLLKTVKWAVPSLIALLTLSVTLSAFFNILHPLWIVAGNPILLEFVFGALLSLLYVRIGQRRIAGILLTAVGTVASFLLQMHNPPTVASGFQMIWIDQGVYYRVATWGVLALVIVAGIVFWSPSLKSPLGKWSVLLGNASYSTYLVSAIGLEFSARLFVKLSHPAVRSLANRFAFETFLLTAVMVLGYFCYILVEKPLLRTLQNKLLRKSPTVSPIQTSVTSAEDSASKATVTNPAA